jgi:hypothetical protein
MNKIALSVSDQLKNLFTTLTPAKDDDIIVVNWDDDESNTSGGYSTSKTTPSMAKFHDDPLALSFASYKLWKKNPHNRWATLDTVKADQEDREIAAQARQYYNNKFMMRMLKGDELTDFQKKMAGFMAGTHQLNIDELGILYRTPYFYYEDIAIDHIIESGRKDLVHHPVIFERQGYELEFVQEVYRSRRGGDVVEFWFLDQNQYPTMISVNVSNPLLSLMRGLSKQKNLSVRGNIKVVKHCGTHRNINYAGLFNWELA